MANQGKLLRHVFEKHTDMELAKACQVEDCPVSPEHCPFMGHRGAAGCSGIKDYDWRIAREAYLPGCGTHTHTDPARGSVLLEAHDTINGQRVNQYGEPENCFGRIAEVFNDWLEKNLTFKDDKGTVYHLSDLGCNLHPQLTAYDAAILMVHFKLCREEHCHKRDNLRDICGYTALAADLAELAQKESTNA